MSRTEYMRRDSCLLMRVNFRRSTRRRVPSPLLKYVKCTGEQWQDLHKQKKRTVEWLAGQDAEWLPAEMITGSKNRDAQAARNARAQVWNNFHDAIRTKMTDAALKSGTLSVTLCARPRFKDGKGDVIVFTSPGLPDPDSEYWKPMIDEFWEVACVDAEDMAVRIEGNDARFPVAKEGKKKEKNSGKAKKT